MHPQAKEFVKESIKNLWKDDYVTVIEFGSRNINGGIRNLLPLGVKYKGIDLAMGDNVDLIANTNDLRAHFPDASADVIICTEQLEHDKHPELTVGEAKRILRKGGLFIMTCAGKDRPAHDVELCGGYYRNILEAEWVEWTRDFQLPYAEISVDGRDLRFWGIK